MCPGFVIAIYRRVCKAVSARQVVPCALVQIEIKLVFVCIADQRSVEYQ